MAWFDNESAINYSKYHLFFGFGGPMEKCIVHRHPTQKVVAYMPGCSADYTNVHSIRRGVEVFEKRKKLLTNSFIIRGEFQLQLSAPDYLIALGNRFTMNTYANRLPEEKLFCLPATFHHAANVDPKQKDFDTAKKNFLWFGSSHMIHKGLDLLLEIFSSRPDIQLHLCGVNKSEKGFLELYAEELNHKKNIINHGFIDINSELFRQLMTDCGFVIFPSVSEGGSPAVITTIANGGLIPVIPASVGLDTFGMEIDIPELTIAAINESINQGLQLDRQEFFHRASFLKEKFCDYHSYEKFNLRVKEIMIKMGL